MFVNKNILLNSVRLSKNKVNHKSMTSFSIYNSKSDYLCCRKTFDNAFIKTNGRGNSLLLNQSISEIKNIEKYSSYNVPEGICWKCKEKRKPKRIDCPSCGALQYPKDKISYYELLGISQSYDINLENLSQKFKDLQKLLHPDKFANKPPEEQEISEKYSRLLNKAYATLKHPLSRGFYLLELLTGKENENYEMEPAFLLFIMEKNEELDCHNTLSSVSHFMEENLQRMNEEMKKISEAFRLGNTDQAKSSLMKLNYFVNLDNKIKEKHRKFTIPIDSK